MAGDTQSGFTIEIEDPTGSDRILSGRDASGRLIGVFFLDDVIRDALKDPKGFRRQFNATVCDAPDIPRYDWKHPFESHPELDYGPPQSASFYVESFRRAAQELGLPIDCEIPMSALPTSTEPHTRPDPTAKTNRGIG